MSHCRAHCKDGSDDSKVAEHCGAEEKIEFISLGKKL